MIQKLIILSALFSITLSQNPLLYCNLAIIENRCTCNFVIFNPNGFNNLTLIANPAENCTLNDVVDAVGSGISPNIPSAICTGLPKLEALKMDKLTISTLNGSPFRYCYNLKNLHLSGNSIAAIPAHAFSFTVLETLKLDSNSVNSVIAASFDNLGSLETLDLNNNAGLSLNNDTFDHLENLKFLCMSSCGIESFTPRLFQNLKELRELDLSGNQFGTVAQNLFSSMTKLETLNLGNCGLTGFSSTAIQNSTELLKFNLENNNVASFVNNFFANQKKLIDLNLANNNRATLFSQLFAPLTSMQVLNLNNCNINSTDNTWFNQMPNLTSINLSNNNISVIPDKTFSSANNLESFNIANNNIEIINSRSFGSLKNLCDLHVEGNKINQIDHHFISQSVDLSVAYFGKNKCANFSTDDFRENRDLYMNSLRNCFDNFDTIPIELTTTNSTSYHWYSIRSNDGWDALKVNIIADENVHIALSDTIDAQAPQIEIKIGEDRNRASLIFENDKQVFKDSVRYRLDPIASSTFIIGWRFGIVMVFKEGAQFPFMAHTIQDRFSVNFFGLRTPFEDEPDSLGIWKVSRLQTSTSLVSMTKIYQDIERRMKSGMSIDLRKYIRN